MMTLTPLLEETIIMELANVRGTTIGLLHNAFYVQIITTTMVQLAYIAQLLPTSNLEEII